MSDHTLRLAGLTRRTRFSRAAVLAIVLTTVAAGCSPRPHAPPSREAGEAAIRTQASLDQPMLVVDLGLARLDLHHGPALLRSFEFSAAELGRSRWASWAWARGVPAVGPWTPVSMSPARRTETRVVRPPEAGRPDPSGSVEWIPPRPEELNPDPDRVRVRYSGGLTLELRADDAPAPGWESAFDGDLIVRLAMSRTDLGMLFRSLPDSTALVVVPPGA